MALYTGLAIACMRASKFTMSMPVTRISRGTGLTPGAKLKRLCDDAPIHSPRSLAFASEVQRPTIRIGFSSWELMYLMRLVTTSMVGPTAPPIKWSSSAMKSETFCTFFLCFHLRLITSHCCGVAMTTWPFSSSFRSVAVSPVRDTTCTPSLSPSLALQSCTRSRANSGVGAMYTHRTTSASFLLSLFSMRRMANSAQTVLPLPVGAPINALSSVLYKHWNTWVCTGLKCLIRGA
mmetsp:Transcript_4987/g.18699  ORF Transcript_4987/g.18699 Transcript_4987/m.18699 type:complete len:235 (-) Transcript_4987:4219-4923(-)